MNDSTILELEIWRGVTSLLLPDMGKIVWSEVRRGWESPTGAPGQNVTNPQGMLRAFREGVGQLPFAQRRVVDSVAQKLSRARHWLSVEDAREISLLEERQKTRDQARHLLEVEEALRVAPARQLGKSVDSPVVDAFIENLAHLARGFYKLRQGVRGHAEGVKFAAEAVERFFRDGAVDTATLRSIQDVARQSEKSQAKRGFGSAMIHWAAEFVQALDRLKREGPQVRGESVADNARQWTLARFADPTQCDKNLDASLKTWRELAARLSEELLQFQAEREKTVQMASRLGGELREIERLVDTEEGFGAFGKKMPELVENMKRLLKVGPEAARVGEVASAAADAASANAASRNVFYPETPKEEIVPFYQPEQPQRPAASLVRADEQTANMNDLLLAQQHQKKSN